MALLTALAIGARTVPRLIRVLAIHGISDVARGDFAGSVAATLGGPVLTRPDGLLEVNDGDVTYLLCDGWWADLSPRPTSTVSALLASLEALWSFLSVARLEKAALKPPRVLSVLFESSLAYVGIVLPSLLVAFSVGLLVFRATYASASAGAVLTTVMAAIAAWPIILVTTRRSRLTGVLQIGGAIAIAAGVYRFQLAQLWVAVALPAVAAVIASLGFTRVQAVPPPVAARWGGALATGVLLGASLLGTDSGLVEGTTLTEASHGVVRWLEECLEAAAAGAIVLLMLAIVAAVVALGRSANERRSLRTLVLVPTFGLLVLWTVGIVGLEVMSPDDDALPPGWVATTCPEGPMAQSVMQVSGGTNTSHDYSRVVSKPSWTLVRAPARPDMSPDELRGKCDSNMPGREKSSYPASLKSAPLGDTDRSLHLLYSLGVLLVGAFLVVHHLPAVLREWLPKATVQSFLPDARHVDRTLTEARVIGPSLVLVVSVALCGAFAVFGILSVWESMLSVRGLSEESTAVLSKDSLSNQFAQLAAPFSWVGALLVTGQAIIIGLVPIVADLGRDTFRAIVPETEGGRSAIQERVNAYVASFNPDVIIAHSQGTLLAHRTGSAAPKVFFGSPIHSFYQQLTPAILGTAPLGRVVNLFSHTDYVGRSLAGYAEVTQGAVEDIAIEGVEGHTRYFDAVNRDDVRGKLLAALRKLLKPLAEP